MHTCQPHCGKKQLAILLCILTHHYFIITVGVLCDISTMASLILQEPLLCCQEPGVRDVQEADQEELRQCHGQEISPEVFHLYILSEGVEQEHFKGTQRSSLLPAVLYQAVWLVGEGYSVITCGGLVPYNRKYWRLIYLAIRFKNSVGKILNWRLRAMHGNKATFTVYMAYI